MSDGTHENVNLGSLNLRWSNCKGEKLLNEYFKSHNINTEDEFKIRILLKRYEGSSVS